MWDTYFGTARPRGESKESNLDWDHPAVTL